MFFEILILFIILLLFLFLNKKLISSIQFFIIFFFTIKYIFESTYNDVFFIDNYFFYLMVFLILIIFYNYIFERIAEVNSKKNIHYFLTNMKNQKIYFLSFLILNALILIIVGSPIFESGDATRTQQAESPLLILIAKTIIFYAVGFIFLTSLKKKDTLSDMVMILLPLVIILFLYNSRLLALMTIFLFISMKTIFNIYNTKVNILLYKYHFIAILLFIFIFPVFRYDMSVFDTFYMIFYSDMLSEYRALALIKSFSNSALFTSFDYILYIITAAIPSNILALIDIDKSAFKINPGVAFKDEIGNAVGGYRLTEPGNILMSIGNDLFMVTMILIFEFIVLIMFAILINKVNLSKIYLLPYLYFLPLIGFFYNFASAFSTFMLFFVVLTCMQFITFMLSKNFVKRKNL